jgi:hypothetical protein
MKKLIISLIVLSVLVMSMASAEMQIEEYSCGDSFTMSEGDTVSVLGHEIEMDYSSSRGLNLFSDGGTPFYYSYYNIQYDGSFFGIDGTNFLFVNTYVQDSMGENILLDIEIICKGCHMGDCGDLDLSCGEKFFIGSNLGFIDYYEPESKPKIEYNGYDILIHSNGVSGLSDRGYEGTSYVNVDGEENYVDSYETERIGGVEITYYPINFASGSDTQHINLGRFGEYGVYEFPCMDSEVAATAPTGNNEETNQRTGRQGLFRSAEDDTSSWWNPLTWF